MWGLVYGAPLDVYTRVFCSELRVLSLSVEESRSALWQESRLNFKGLPKVSGVATNHWVFLRCDYSPVSS